MSPRRGAALGRARGMPTMVGMPLRARRSLAVVVLALAAAAGVWAVGSASGLIGGAASQPHSGTSATGQHHREHATPATDPMFRGADTSGATEGQLQAARDLIVRTRAAVAGALPDEAAVVAAGYRSIGDGTVPGSFEHFVNATYLADGRELDPHHIESMVLERTSTGKRVVSAMFILEMGKTLADAPDIAGKTTAWHDHQDLCWDAPTMRLAGRLVNGRCVPGGTFAPTPPMLHVWLGEHPCGPFAGIDGHGASCARHAHSGTPGAAPLPP